MACFLLDEILKQNAFQIENCSIKLRIERSLLKRQEYIHTQRELFSKEKGKREGRYFSFTLFQYCYFIFCILHTDVDISTATIHVNRRSMSSTAATATLVVTTAMTATTVRAASSTATSAEFLALESSAAVTTTHTRSRTNIAHLVFLIVIYCVLFCLIPEKEID